MRESKNNSDAPVKVACVWILACVFVMIIGVMKMIRSLCGCCMEFCFIISLKKKRSMFHSLLILS